jgi:hypothetical protein
LHQTESEELMAGEKSKATHHFLFKAPTWSTGAQSGDAQSGKHLVWRI